MSDWIPRLQEWISSALGVPATYHQPLALSVALIALLWLIRSLILRVVARRADMRAQYRWKKVSGYVAVILALLALVRLWFGGIQSLATYFGLLSAGLAIALKDLVVNFAGWLFILWRRPFEVGDRIEIGERAGDVIDLRIFQFTLMEIGNWVHADQSTGRIIHIPNGLVFSQPVASYTKGFQMIWDELEVLVTFESDWKKAKAILQEIAEERGRPVAEQAAERVRQAAQRFMIVYSKLTPIVYTKVVDSGVLLTVRYLVNPRTRRGSAEAIWEDILAAFAEHSDIDFAYPTMRYYDNVTEGKPDARARPETLGPTAGGDWTPGGDG
ncbi:MAG: mechanosensitive ion channel domain-containing protein [Acidobacteriota bacterium]